MRACFTVLAMMGALALAGCSEDAAAPRGEKTSVEIGDTPTAPVAYRLETVADGLDHPWSLAFLPDGGMLLTERGGAVKHVAVDGATNEIFNFTTLKEAPLHTRAGAQAGLFEVAPHPDFETNQTVFFSYAGKVGAEENTLMLMRFRLEQDGEKLRLVEGRRIFEAKPSRRQSNHYGGRIAFLPDGTLLIPHGEGFDLREQAQILDNHFGKLLRLTEDGAAPADNPFQGREDALPEIYSYGHRNAQGVLIAADGRILMHEHGPAGGDEINVIEPGANYGWPVVSYGRDYSGARITPLEAWDGTTQSLLHFTPSIAPSGFVQYQGDVFPEWKGDLFLSTLVDGHVRRIDMGADGALGAQQKLFGELKTRFRDVRAGPDGFLYLLTETREGPGGALIRVRPAPTQ